MMQMLVAGGMTALTDLERKPDVDNPRGYFEWEPVKRLANEPNLIDQAEGRVVKIISQLVLSVPAGRTYKLIFMERPLPEVLASQDEMLRRRGKDASADPIVITDAFRNHLREVMDWLEARDDIPVCRVGYRKLVRAPLDTAQAVRDFLGLDLNPDEMARQVDPALYRNRRS